MYILKINITEKSEYALEADLFYTQNIVLTKFLSDEDIVRIANKHCNFALGVYIELEIYSAEIDLDGVIVKKDLIKKIEVN